MIPNTAVRLVTSSPIAETAEFGISMNDTAHIMGILRSQLYSDKILAVLREYGANAWDAHRDAGKFDIPIKVTLPTLENPTLSIRDYGLGLSPDGVFKVFTQYGASTKRNSDNSVGMLGIGSKSGFAYSDSFTITSYYAGTKRTYVAVLDESEKGRIDLLCQELCGSETGVEISIAVHSEDIYAFTKKATELYQYFVPQPIINTVLPKPFEGTDALKSGVLYTTDAEWGSRPAYNDGSTRNWVAVMGCVPYHINLDQISGNDATPEGGVASFLFDLKGALYFDIGDINISASREELKYSNETKLALVRKFNSLVDEFVARALKDLNRTGITPWERRIRAQALRVMRIPLPETEGDVLDTHVQLEKKVPPSFVLLQFKTPTSSIRVEPSARLILEDDKRSKRGFADVSGYDYFVRPVTRDKDDKPVKFTWPAIEADVEKLCRDTGLTGIPIVKLSTFTWAQPARAGNRTLNPKHRVALFKLVPEKRYKRMKSEAWEVSDHVPDPSDVFVIIYAFAADFDFIGEYGRMLELAEAFKITLPVIYAYKSTDKKPVHAVKCVGTEFRTWQAKFTASLLTPEVMEHYQFRGWADVLRDDVSSWRFPTVTVEKYKKVVEALGEAHVLSVFAKNVVDGMAFFLKQPSLRRGLEILGHHCTELDPQKSIAKAMHRSILQTYPLFQGDGTSVAQLWGPRSADWLQYVKLIDKEHNGH